MTTTPAQKIEAGDWVRVINTGRTSLIEGSVHQVTKRFDEWGHGYVEINSLPGITWGAHRFELAEKAAPHLIRTVMPGQAPTTAGELNASHLGCRVTFRVGDDVLSAPLKEIVHAGDHVVIQVNSIRPPEQSIFLKPNAGFRLAATDRVLVEDADILRTLQSLVGPQLKPTTDGEANA